MYYLNKFTRQVLGVNQSFMAIWYAPDTQTSEMLFPLQDPKTILLLSHAMIKNL